MAGRPRIPEVERFMSHVAKSDGACWLWTAYCLPSGYGNFRTPARHELAHRASFRLFKGPLDSREVMHSCDVPGCVNPAHLTLGTRTQNMQDAKQKGRHAHGASHGRSKLTAETAAFARTAPLLQREIAAILGITQGHVSAIQSNARWNNV